MQLVVHSSFDRDPGRCLQAILHACLAHAQLSLDKFSRWARSICSILLAEGTSPNRSKAIQYFEQAAAVLEEHGNLVENGNPVGVSRSVDQ